MRINDAFLVVQAEFPDVVGSRAPGPDGSSPVVIFVYVSDVDQAVERAVAVGARILIAAQNQFLGDRTARIVDPSGHVWTVASRIEETTEEQRAKRWSDIRERAVPGLGMMKTLKRCRHILLGALAFWPTLSWLAAQETLPASTMVEVDGLRLRVLTDGIGNRDPAQAVIVFESGGSAPLETWDAILPAVSRFAPIVAYDRAGTGESEWDGLSPTPERVAARLRKLLTELNVAPPYILVGHSWGGALVRYFAGFYPDEVVGTLYIDPTDITLSPAEELAVFASIGANDGARNAFYQIQERAMANAPDPLRAEAAVILSLMRKDTAERGLPESPDIPASVIVAGKPAVFPRNALPFDSAAYALAMYQDRLQRLRGWVREPGSFLVASDSGHIVHADAPEAVIEAIRRLVGIEQ
jgi:pimeloyl-ACP methyl ester carboxylesterase